MQVYLEGIGLRGPGLPDWDTAQPILAGMIGYEPAPIILKASDLLPRAEQRRTTDAVKLAMVVASEAALGAGRNPASMSSVFASSDGDGATLSAILEALLLPERQVSPTQFHNSVHNAPAGYWSMATQSRENSTSLSAYDCSFAAGFIEAAGQATIEDKATLLVIYDLPCPQPLYATRPLVLVFGAAMILSPHATPHSIANLTLGLDRVGAEESSMPGIELETLRTGNPAARALPLLASVARGEPSAIVLRHVGGNNLRIQVTPCRMSLLRDVALDR